MIWIVPPIPGWSKMARGRSTGWHGADGGQELDSFGTGALRLLAGKIFGA